jgi:hypothetical protein
MMPDQSSSPGSAPAASPNSPPALNLRPHHKPREPRRTAKPQPTEKIAEKVAFKLWLAMPSWERDPQDQRALAKKLQVDEGTLSDWKRIPGFMDEVADLARQWARQFIPDVFGAMVHSAADRLGGTAQDRKLFLQYFQDWAPRERQEVTGRDGQDFQLVFVKKPSDLKPKDGAPANHPAQP